MSAVIVDATTGQVTTRALTHEEQAQREDDAATEAVRLQAEQDEAIARGQARGRAMQQATGLAGANIAALTPAQVRAALALLLQERGALNGDGTIRSPTQWIRG